MVSSGYGWCLYSGHSWALNRHDINLRTWYIHIIGGIQVEKKWVDLLFALPFSRRRGHFTHEPRAVTMKLWEPKRNVSQGRPKHTSKSCSVVTGPRVQCEAICDRSLSQMLFWWFFLFMWVLTYDINRMNQWFVSVRSAMVSQFCVRPPSKRWFHETWSVRWCVGVHVDFYIHRAFIYSVGPSSAEWSELGLALPFPPMRVIQVVLVTGSQAHVWSGPK
jgi:hypothetical protein